MIAALLSQQLSAILASQTYKNGGAIFITWDEGEGGDGPIGMIVLSPFAKRNYSNTIHYTHSSTLRTMQEIFNVGPLLRDAERHGFERFLHSEMAPRRTAVLRLGPAACGWHQARTRSTCRPHTPESRPLPLAHQRPEESAKFAAQGHRKTCKELIQESHLPSSVAVSDFLERPRGGAEFGCSSF